MADTPGEKPSAKERLTQAQAAQSEAGRFLATLFPIKKSSDANRYIPRDEEGQPIFDFDTLARQIEPRAQRAAQVQLDAPPIDEALDEWVYQTMAELATDALEGALATYLGDEQQRHLLYVALSDLGVRRQDTPVAATYADTVRVRLENTASTLPSSTELEDAMGRPVYDRVIRAAGALGRQQPLARMVTLLDGFSPVHENNRIVWADRVLTQIRSGGPIFSAMSDDPSADLLRSAQLAGARQEAAELDALTTYRHDLYEAYRAAGNPEWTNEDIEAVARERVPVARGDFVAEIQREIHVAAAEAALGREP